MSNARAATEADFNALSRCVLMKVDIYFNGIDSEPFTIDRDNYLIDLDILEEASADTNSPFGAVSANEVSFSLLNPNGIFSPTNVDSPLYGKINVGTPLRVYMRPFYEHDEVDWEPMGLFFITDWTAAITGITADVSASDTLYTIFERPQVKLPVIKNVSIAEYARLFFEALGEQADIDDNLTEMLVYGYTKLSNKNFLKELSIGAQSYIFCGRDGVPVIKYARGAQEVDHELTDYNQVVDINSQQSAVFKYNGVNVIINTPQESDDSTLLTIKQIKLADSSYKSIDTSFSKQPVIKVSAALVSGGYDVSIKDMSATSLDVLYSLQSTVKNAEATLSFTGTYVDVVSTSYSDVGDSLLKVDNDFVQTGEYAQKFKRLLDAYVTNAVPVLKLTIRGNALFKLGEKLHVVSDKYGVDFSGLLVRQHYKYDGSLSCDITLMNSKIMEVV